MSTLPSEALILYFRARRFISLGKWRSAYLALERIDEIMASVA